MARKAGRPPLTPERVVDAALALADAEGLAALSMRKLAQALGVEAMSLYNHMANKDALLAALVDRVITQIERPPPGTPWRAAMRTRALSARRVLLRHPWAAGLMETRTRALSPTHLAYADGILGCLRADGFSVEQAYRAFLLLDSYLYGFTLQEQSWGLDAATMTAEVAQHLPLLQAHYPHLAEAMAGMLTGGPDHDTEFAVGLEHILEALEGVRRKG